MDPVRLSEIPSLISQRFPGTKAVVVTGSLPSLALIALFQERTDYEIVYVDSWTDFPWLRSYILSYLSRVENARVISPNPPYLFYDYLFRRGYPPPRPTFRWHTRRVLVEPVERAIVSYNYSAIILGTSISDLPDHKRVRAVLTLWHGIGVSRQQGTGVPMLFPFASAEREDVNSLAREFHDSDIVESLLPYPRPSCWLCDFPDSEGYAARSLLYEFYGSQELYDYRREFMQGAYNPKNREVDEGGYPRSLKKGFRRLMYVGYQLLASRLRRVPGYLPRLPPASVFGLSEA